MERIETAPLQLDPAAVAERLRLPAGRDPLGRAEALIARVVEAAEPQAGYAAWPVEGRDEESLRAGGARFESRVLARYAGESPRLFPYVVTLGARLGELLAGAAGVLEQYCLEEVANLALRQAQDSASEEIARRHGLPPLSSLNPGSLADWPLSEQRVLFGALGDVEGVVGVRLTESLLMLPRKSVSGLLFSSLVPFVACRLCGRRHCPSRRAESEPEAAGQGHC